MARPTTLVLILCLFFPFETYGQMTPLHEFTGGTDDGHWPWGRLTLNGSTLFGTTVRGGGANKGSIFSIHADGSGYSLLHDFTGSDGAFPGNSLTLDGSTLYGTASRGGDSNLGTVFSMGVDGTGFTLLRSLNGNPHTGLTMNGSTLFGTTYWGGEHNLGSLFSLNSDGTDFKVLHAFAGGTNDGRAPMARLTLSGTTLYGTTFSGGVLDQGTLYSINTDGTGFRLVHEFAGIINNDGSNPVGDLTLRGSTIFGTTCGSGDDALGIVYSLNTDGTNFRRLHAFAGGAQDGRCPWDGLVLSGSKLYGTTQFGGDACREYAWGCGTIFSMNTDGAEFTLLHAFAGGPADGRRPIAGLTLNGSTLFGSTWHGGERDLGTVFAFVIPEPAAGDLTAGVLVLFIALARNIGSRVGRLGEGAIGVERFISPLCLRMATLSTEVAEVIPQKLWTMGTNVDLAQMSGTRGECP